MFAVLSCLCLGFGLLSGESFFRGLIPAEEWCPPLALAFLGWLSTCYRGPLPSLLIFLLGIASDVFHGEFLGFHPFAFQLSFLCLRPLAQNQSIPPWSRRPLEGLILISVCSLSRWLTGLLFAGSRGGALFDWDQLLPQLFVLSISLQLLQFILSPLRYLSVREEESGGRIRLR